MAKTMIASDQMTDGQIENLVAKLRDAVRKHRSEFPKDLVQDVLGVENLGMELLEPFRKRLEAISDLIVRHVKVNRGRTPQEALKATGRNLYVNDTVVATMPRGEGEETDVYFFKLNRYISDADLEKEYQLRGLAPADPYSLAAVNEADPAFADERPNGTYWQDGDGKGCFAAFRRWGGERHVYVDPNDNAWNDNWWFAGLRK